MTARNFELSLPRRLPDGRYVSMIVESTRNEHYRERYTRLTGLKRGLITGRRRATTGLLGVCVILILLMSSLINAPAAQANPFTDAIKNASNDITCRSEAHFAKPKAFSSGTPGIGIGKPVIYNDMKRGGDDQFSESRHTFYEKTWGAGAQWTLWTSNEVTRPVADNYLGLNRGDVTPEDPLFSPQCWPVGDLISSGMGNAMLDATGFVVGVTNWFYQQAYQPTFLDGLNDTVTKMIVGDENTKGLKDILYFEFLTLMLVLGSLYLGWGGLVKKASIQAMQEFGFMLVATLVGSMMVFNPSMVLSGVKQVAGIIDTAMLTTAVSAVTNTAAKEDSFCYVPAEAPGNKWGDSNLDVRRLQALRVTECSLYTMFVYTPWVHGQYGLSLEDARNLPGTENFSTDLGGDFAVRGDLPMKQFELQTLTVDGNTTGMASIARERIWHETIPVAVANSDDVASTWMGLNGGMDRVGISMLAFVVAIFGSVSIVIIAGSMLIMSVGITLLTLVSPFFLLLGVNGATRGVMMRWVELLVSTIAKRLMLSILLGLTISLYAFVIHTSSLGYLATSGTLIFLSIALLVYRKQFTGLLDNNIKFGGTGADWSRPTAGVVGHGSALGKTVAMGAGGAALGALKGGGTGALLGGLSSAAKGSREKVIGETVTQAAARSGSRAEKAFNASSRYPSQKELQTKAVTRTPSGSKTATVASDDKQPQKVEKPQKPGKSTAQLKDDLRKRTNERVVAKPDPAPVPTERSKQSKSKPFSLAEEKEALRARTSPGVVTEPSTAATAPVPGVPTDRLHHQADADASEGGTFERAPRTAQASDLGTTPTPNQGKDNLTPRPGAARPASPSGRSQVRPSVSRETTSPAGQTNPPASPVAPRRLGASTEAVSKPADAPQRPQNPTPAPNTRRLTTRVDREAMRQQAERLDKGREKRVDEGNQKR